MKQKEEFSPTVKMKDLTSELEVQVINGASSTCMQMCSPLHNTFNNNLILILNFKRAYLDTQAPRHGLLMHCKIIIIHFAQWSYFMLLGADKML